MNRPISVARFTGWVISCRQPSTKVLGLEFGHLEYVSYYVY
jgi:hypothetical protein